MVTNKRTQTHTFIAKVPQTQKYEKQKSRHRIGDTKYEQQTRYSYFGVS